MLRVTEHRAEVVRCPACGHRTKAEFPESVRARVKDGPSVLARALYLHDYQLLPYTCRADVMKELFCCAPSKVTLSTAVKQCADRLVETELKIKQGLRRSAVLHADETGLQRRREGQLL
jgi:transposase